MQHHKGLLSTFSQFIELYRAASILNIIFLLAKLWACKKKYDLYSLGRWGTDIRWKLFKYYKETPLII